MSQSYQQRCATVVAALEAEHVTAPPGVSLGELAVKVLAALDRQRETIR
jgi:hypothetical protein